MTHSLQPLWRAPRRCGLATVSVTGAAYVAEVVVALDEAWSQMLQAFAWIRVASGTEEFVGKTPHQSRVSEDQAVVDGRQVSPPRGSPWRVPRCRAT